MEKWIKYHLSLVRIAFMDTKARLSFLGGNIGQLIYSIGLVLLGFVITYPYGEGHNFMGDFLVSLKGGVIAAILGNVVIYLVYLFRSKRRLFHEIGIHRYQDLNPEDPEIEVSEWTQMNPNFVVLFVVNHSAYPVDCLFRIKEVKNISDPKFSFPKIDKALEWWGEGKGETRIEPGINNQHSITILKAEGDKLKFVTIPINPHRLDFGNYLITVELEEDYWWKKYTQIINLEVEYRSAYQLNWKKI